MALQTTTAPIGRENDLANESLCFNHKNYNFSLQALPNQTLFPSEKKHENVFFFSIYHFNGDKCQANINTYGIKCCFFSYPRGR